MSLAERLSSMAPNMAGRPCGIAQAKLSMPLDEQEALDMWMFDPDRRRSNLQILDALNAENYNVSKNSVDIHRRRECRCFIGVEARAAAEAQADA